MRPSDATAAAEDQAAQQLERAHPVAVAGQRLAEPRRLVEQPEHGLLATADVRQGAGTGEGHLDQIAELGVEIEPEAVERRLAAAPLAARAPRPPCGGSSASSASCRSMAASRPFVSGVGSRPRSFASAARHWR